LDQAFEEMAETYQQPVDHIKGYYSQNQEGLALFKQTMLEKKALKVIIDNGQITEIKPKVETESTDMTEDTATEE